MPRLYTSLRSVGLLGEHVLGRKPKLREHLTDEFVAQLQPAEREYSVHDSSFELSLAVRVRPNGSASYIYSPSSLLAGGKAKRITLGATSKISVQQARQRAGDIARGVAETGIALAAYMGPVRAETLAAIVPVYLTTEAKRHSLEWRKKVRLAFERRIVPALGHLPLDELRAPGVRVALDQCSPSKSVLRQDFFILSALLTFAVKHRGLEQNPLRGSLAPARPAMKRRMPLTIERAASLFEVAGSLAQPWTAFFQFLILSGLPAEEILAISGSEIDEEMSTLTRNRELHPAYRLTPEEAAALTRIARPGAYLFGTRPNETPKRFSRAALLALRDASSLQDVTVRDISKFVGRQIRIHGNREEWISQLLAAVALQKEEVVL